ncbi:MAG: OmpA family protein [Gammaproteobacteria bacterium]|nr:OmpA family protein [Gammaproteobacteria bacterium]
MIAADRRLLGPPEWKTEVGDSSDEESWLLIYLDVFTLMLSIFVLMLAYASKSADEFEQLARTLAKQPEKEQIEQPVESPVTPPEMAQEPATNLPEVPMEDRTVEEVIDQQQVQDDLREMLVEQGLEGAVELTASSNQINLLIRDNILFEPGKDELSPAGRELLGKLVPLLNERKSDISVEGHTDSVPISNDRFASNWELSSRRATVVLRQLIAQGVPAERMRAIGYAATQPVDSNDTLAGRQRNRRVSLVMHLQE